jgi:hypothetical protein
MEKTLKTHARSHPVVVAHELICLGRDIRKIEPRLARLRIGHDLTRPIFKGISGALRKAHRELTGERFGFNYLNSKSLKYYGDEVLLRLTIDLPEVDDLAKSAFYGPDDLTERDHITLLLAISTVYGRPEFRDLRSLPEQDGQFLQRVFAIASPETIPFPIPARKAP